MFFLPDIAGMDYDNVRRLLGCCLPYSYHDWIKLSCALARERGSVGFAFVPVRFTDFAGFALAGERAPDLETLLDYCARIGSAAAPKGLTLRRSDLAALPA